MKESLTRRQMLKLSGAALAAIPVLAFTGEAPAATNAAMRAAMKYQDGPSGGKRCGDCLQFIAGKSPNDLGGCKLFAGDTEVSPEGFCVGWVAAPKK